MATYRVIKGTLSRHPEGRLLNITPEHAAVGHDVERLLRLGVIEEDEGLEGEEAVDLDGGAAVPAIPYLEPTAEPVTTPRAKAVSGGAKPRRKPPTKPSAAKKG